MSPCIDPAWSTPSWRPACEVRGCHGRGRHTIEVQGPRVPERRWVCRDCHRRLTGERPMQPVVVTETRTGVPRGVLVPGGVRALVLAAVADGVADVATLRQRLDLTSSKAHGALRFLRETGRLCGWDVTDKGREELGRMGGAE